MLTLITYYVLVFPPENRILAAFNILAILPLFVSFILDLHLISYVIIYALDFILSSKKKYYTNLNKKRYEQNDTRL